MRSASSGIVTRSVIFGWLRALAPKPMGTTPFFGTLLRCPQCMGFWAGVLHALGGFAILALGDDQIIKKIVLVEAGCAASGLCYFAMLVCEKLGQGPLDELASQDGASSYLGR